MGGCLLIVWCFFMILNSLHGLYKNDSCFQVFIFGFSHSGAGMDYADPKRKSNIVGKIVLAAALTALCIIMLKQSPTFGSRSSVPP